MERGNWAYWAADDRKLHVCDEEPNQVVGAAEGSEFAVATVSRPRRPRKECLWRIDRRLRGQPCRDCARRAGAPA